MKPDKPFLTSDQLVETLKNKNIFVNDSEKDQVIEDLEDFGYFALIKNGLNQTPIKEKTNNKNRFIEKVDFNELSKIHQIDNEISAILLKYLGFVEETLRARMGMVFGALYGADSNVGGTISSSTGFLKKSHYIKVPKDKRYKRNKLRALVEKKDFEKESELKNIRKFTSSEEIIPIEAFFIDLTFGELTNLLTISETVIKDNLFKTYLSENKSPSEFRKILIKLVQKMLPDFRNLSAHRRKLINYHFNEKINYSVFNNLFPKGTNPIESDEEASGIIGVIFSIIFFLNDKELSEGLLKEITELYNKEFIEDGKPKMITKEISLLDVFDLPIDLVERIEKTLNEMAENNYFNHENLFSDSTGDQSLINSFIDDTLFTLATFGIKIDELNQGREILMQYSPYRLYEIYKELENNSPSLEELRKLAKTQLNFYSSFYKYILYAENSFKTRLSSFMAESLGVTIFHETTKRLVVDPHESGYLCSLCLFNENEKPEIISRIENDLLNKIRRGYTESLKKKDKNSQLFPIPGVSITQYYLTNHNHVPPWILVRDLTFNEARGLYNLLPYSMRRKFIDLLFPDKLINLSEDQKEAFLDLALGIMLGYRNAFLHYYPSIDDIDISIPVNWFKPYYSERVLIPSFYRIKENESSRHDSVPAIGGLHAIILLSIMFTHSSDVALQLNNDLKKFIKEERSTFEALDIDIYSFYELPRNIDKAFNKYNKGIWNN